MNPAPGAWAVPILLLLALAAALAAAVLLWRRARTAAATAPAPAPGVGQLQQRMFKAAMAALYPRDADRRYDKPCVLVCGAAASGKSALLRGAGLEPVEALPGKDSGWWRSTEGIAFELPDGAWEADGGPWFDFLRLLDRHRGRRALDAVVWTIPLAALESGRVEGERMYRKCADIQDRLGLHLPVYVVVTGCDRAAGFAPWAARLPEAAHAQPLGWSNPDAPGSAWRAQDGEQAVGRVLQGLRRLVGALAARRDLDGDAAAIFLMPERLGTALARLPRALQEAMRQNAAMAPFDLRGIYLSGRAAGAEADAAPSGADPFAPVPPRAPAPAPVFCRELFAQRIFGEFGLAAVVQRRLHAERRSRLAVLGGAGLFAAVWLLALVPTWFSARQQFGSIRGPLTGVQSVLADKEARGDRAGAHFDEYATVALLEKMDNVRDWSTPQAALPLSWHSCCGGLRDEIDRALSLYYSEVLFEEIDQALGARAGAITAPASSGADNGDLAARPDQMSQYQALDKFLDDTLAYESQHRRFEELASPNGGSWKATVSLLRYLFGVELAAASPRTVARFDALLRQSSYRAGNRDTERERQRFAARARRLHDAFLDAAFGDNRLLRLQRELVKHVGELQSDQTDQHLLLASLQREIGELRTLLTRTNAVWMADGHLVGGDAYRAIETKIRKSRYLGDELAGELRAEAGVRQNDFRTGIDADSSGTYPVLAYTEGKQLLVDPDLEGLQLALGQLLQHRFSQGAADTAGAPPDPARPLVWNVDQLTAARDLLTDLQAYEAADLAKAPVRYQPTLRKLARIQAAALVEQELAAAAVPAQCDAAWRCANLDDARQLLGDIVAALRKLELGIPADRWQHLVDRQALMLLGELGAIADQGSLYLPDAQAVPAWNGARGSAFHAYGVQAAGELQDFLDRQLQQVGDLAQKSKGPRAWLTQSGARAPDGAQRLLTDWSRVDAELARHAAAAPAGSLRRLERFIAEDLATLDAANCAERLGRGAPPDADLFQRRMARVAAVYRPHCIRLEERVTREAYGRIAAHYDRQLLHRFPFAAARDAAPAEPDDVRQLLHLLDAHAATLRGTLGRRKDPQSAAALAFLERLAATQPVLAALLADDPSGGPAALDLWPQFRINRAREKGAEQIIEWAVRAGDSLPPPVAGANPGVAWRMGQPIDMTLRWAKNSTLRPATSPTRPRMRVSDGAARWQYDDPWALLHLLADHAAPLSDLNEREARAPVVLRFAVPTQDAAGAPVGDTVAYARLAVSVHGKPERLAVPAFPATPAPPLQAAAKPRKEPSNERRASAAAAD